MTLHQRYSAGECVRLMELLAEADTPHSKELATIVATRLVAIADDTEEPAAMPMSDIEPWLEIGRQLVAVDGISKAGT